ncbi:MAG: 50S ribosomal protein L25 [Phycisphaerales bacterium]|nr:50S ribosomal protein L25 [Phycisphaerales bacterium]
MTTKAPILKGIKRDRVGSRYSRRLRQTGMTPAVVYGHGREPVSVAVSTEDAYHHIFSGERVFELSIDGEKSDTCLLKALQYDHLGTEIVHIDFARVSMDERVELRVMVKLVGTPVGLKVAGAILEHPATELLIECRVTNIPDFIKVDISQLEEGESIHARSVQLPGAEMVLKSDQDAIVARVEVLRHVEEEVAEVAAEAEGEEGEEGEAKAEPEVEEKA